MHRFTDSGFDKLETHSKFSALLNRILDSYPNDSKERGFLAFVSGVGMGVGDGMAHELVTLNGKSPTKKEIENYVIRVHREPVSALLLEIAYMKHVAPTGSIPPSKLMKEANLIFFATALNEWAYYKMNPQNYSGFMDSIGAYTKNQLRDMGFPDWSL